MATRCPLALLFWAAVAVTLAMALLPHPPQLLPGDKQEHGLAFASLTVLAAFAYPAVRLRYQVAALAGFGAAIEFLQLIPTFGRDADVRDWAADLLAALAAACLIGCWRRWGPARGRAGAPRVREV